MKLKRTILKTVIVNIALILFMIGLLSVVPPILYNSYRLIKKHGNTKASDSILSGYSWYEDYLKEYGMLKDEYVDFLVWRQVKFDGKTINIDENGLRRTKQATNIENESVRYLFFGASTIWGYGAPDALTIPSLYTEKKSVEIVNYGQLGYGSRQIFTSIANYYIERSQDDRKKNVVILCDGLIDPYYFCRNNQKEIVSSRQYDIQMALKAPLSFSYILAPSMFLASKIKMKFARDETGEELWYCACDDCDRADYIAETIVRTWVFAEELVSANNDDFFAVFPPSAAIGSPCLEHLQTPLDPGWIQSARKVYSLVKEKVEAYPEINFIDLTDIFNSDEPIYIDRCHYSPKGNEIYVEALSREIESFSE